MNNNTNKWNPKQYDKILIRVPKGYSTDLKEYIDSFGYSLNSFILEAIQEKVDRIPDDPDKRPAKIIYFPQTDEKKQTE
jgi:hypothetical protein